VHENRTASAGPVDPRPGQRVADGSPDDQGEGFSAALRDLRDAVEAVLSPAHHRQVLVGRGCRLVGVPLPVLGGEVGQLQTGQALVL
jgi:hypothetical protein